MCPRLHASNDQSKPKRCDHSEFSALNIMIRSTNRVDTLHLPRGLPLALEQTLSPSGYMHPHTPLLYVSLWPAQLQRAAIGFAAAASHGLATAPASCNVSARTTWHWRTRVLRRVMGGYVDRIQVRWSCRLIDTLRKQLNTPANRFLNAKAGAHVQGHQTNKAGARSCW
jgi:hypothetical protein